MKKDHIIRKSSLAALTIGVVLVFIVLAITKPKAENASGVTITHSLADGSNNPVKDGDEINITLTIPANPSTQKTVSTYENIPITMPTSFKINKVFSINDFRLTSSNIHETAPNPYSPDVTKALDAVAEGQDLSPTLLSAKNWDNQRLFDPAYVGPRIAPKGSSIKVGATVNLESVGLVCYAYTAKAGEASKFSSIMNQKCGVNSPVAKNYWINTPAPAGGLKFVFTGKVSLTNTKPYIEVIAGGVSIKDDIFVVPPAPNLIKPDDEKTFEAKDTSPIFSWTTVKTAKSYNLVINKVDNSDEALIDQNVNTTSINIGNERWSALPKDTPLEWHINAFDEDGTLLVASASRQFKIKGVQLPTAPNLSNPADETIFSTTATATNPPDFSWSKVDNAVYYVLKLTKEISDSWSKEVETDSASISSTGFWKDLPLGERLSWSVTPLTADRQAGATSISRQFKIDGTWTTPDNTPPAPPTNLKAEDAKTDGSINLSWTNPTDSDFLKINVYRSTTSGSIGALIKTTDYSPAVSSYSDAGLANGTKYYYTFRSLDGSGNESTNTNQVSATPTKPVVALEYIDTGISLPAGWSMVAFSNDNIYAKQIPLTNPFETGIIAFSWDNSSAQYVDLRSSSNLPTPGNGFWVYSPQFGNLKLKGVTALAQSTVIGATDKKVTNKSWVLAGNPFSQKTLDGMKFYQTQSASTLISYAQAKEQGLVGPAYAYDNSQNKYVLLNENSVVDKNEGFWIYIAKDNVAIRY